MAITLLILMYAVYGLSVAGVAVGAYKAANPADKPKPSPVFFLCLAIFLVIVGSAFLRSVVSWEPLYVSVSVALAALVAGLATRATPRKDA